MAFFLLQKFNNLTAYQVINYYVEEFWPLAENLNTKNI